MQIVMASGTPYDFSFPVAKPILILDDSELEELDGSNKETADTHGDTVSTGKQLCHVNSVHSARTLANIPQSVLIGSLLEHICSMYESNPQKSQKLFKTICLQLQKIHMVSPLSYLEEYASIRFQYKASFYSLMQSSILQVNPKMALSTNVQTDLNNALMKTVPSFSTDHFFKFAASRYNEEFEEQSELGVGAFGKVYKARNKIDHQEYAIKKIHFKDVSVYDEPQAVKKIMREVESLASLQHPHVVRYHCSWMEHHFCESSDDNDSAEMINSSPEHSSYTSSNFLGVPNSAFRDEDFLKMNDSNSINNSWHSFSDNASRGGNSGKFWQLGGSDDDEDEEVPLTKEEIQVVEFKDTYSSSPPSDVIVTEGVRNVSYMKRVKSFIACNPTKSHLHSYSLSSSNPRKLLRSKSLNSMKLSTKTLKEMTIPVSESVEGLLSTELVLYIQMQLCETSLQKWLIKRNDLLNGSYDIDEAKAYDIFRQLLSALDYIHGKEILHRDLKPRNILINGIRPHIFLGDFGLSRPALSRHSSDLLTPVANLHSYGFDFDEHTSGVGTTVYASPEQLKHENYDYKADMYSAGIIFFELTWPVYTGHQRSQLIPDLRNGKISEQYRNKWPDAVSILELLISHDPLKRPSASDLLNDGRFMSKNSKTIISLNKENARLQEENTRLHEEISRFQKQMTKLEEENAYLKQQIL